MNKKKIIIGAMIAVFFAALLHITSLPGKGIISVVIMLPAATLFSAISIGKKNLFVIRIFNIPISIKEQNNSDTKEGTNKPNLKEMCCGLSLSVLTIGILFKLMNWPGGNINLLIGAISTIICACIILLTNKPDNQNYSSDATIIAIASLVYALFFGTPYFYNYLEKSEIEGSDCLEYYENYKNDPSESNQATYRLERFKLQYIGDKGQYNELKKKKKKAKEEAEETGAKVLYFINDFAYDIEISKTSSSNSKITIEEIPNYLNLLKEYDINQNKFILVTNQQEQSIIKLTNTPWRQDSFEVKTADSTYQFGPNM